MSNTVYVDQNLLFVGLDDESAAKLVDMCNSITVVGKPIDWDDPLWVLWYQKTSYESGKRLLIMSTVFPGKAALSVANYYASKLHIKSDAEIALKSFVKSLGNPALDKLIKKYEDQLSAHKDAETASQFAGDWGYARSAEMKMTESILADLKEIRDA